MTEAKIKNDIRIALGSEPDLELMNNPQGVFAASANRYVRVGLGVGSPDLIGILAPHGRVFALEVKKPEARNRVSKEQKLCHQRWRALGAFVAVVTSVEEAKAALARARDGKKE